MVKSADGHSVVIASSGGGGHTAQNVAPDAR
jgi:hypothetical protein